jgi:polyhydroxybutyrate depolymerase
MKKLNSILKFEIPLLFVFVFQLHVKAHSDSINVAGIYRTYIIHLPVGYTSTQKYPVVFNLHGLSSNAAQQEAYSNFNAIADASNFIVVYPNAIASNWNVSGAKTAPNDSAFIGNLMDSITSRYSVNTCRFYATGFSQGGFMSYALACMFADRFAAIAVVSGNMFNATVAACHPHNPIPIMHIHGTADPIVLYWGIIGLESWVPGTVYWWAQQNNCNLTPTHTILPNPVLSDSSNVEMYYYAPGPDSCEVIYIQVNNGGHTWPGASIMLPFGFTNKDFSASKSIWNFFNTHSLKDCITSGFSDGESVIDNIIIYPNPFTSQTTISFSNEQINTSIKITDILGQEIKNLNFTGRQLTIDTALLKAGIYYVLIIDEKKKVTKKKIIIL